MIDGPFLAVGFNLIKKQFHLTMLTIAGVLGDRGIPPFATADAYNATAIDIDATLAALDKADTTVTKAQLKTLCTSIDTTMGDALQLLIDDGYTEEGDEAKITEPGIHLAVMLEKFVQIMGASGLASGEEAKPVEPETNAKTQPHNPLTCPECGEAMDEDEIVIASVPIRAKDAMRAHDILRDAGILVSVEDLPRGFVESFGDAISGKFDTTSATFH